MNPIRLQTLVRPLLLALCLALSAANTCLAAADPRIAEAEQQVTKTPKPVLKLVQAQLKSQLISAEDRPVWLALGSEAAYALALPDLALRYAKEGLDRPALSAELQQRLSIAYAQGLDLAGKSKESVDLLMTVVATLEKGGFDRQYLVDALNARASAYYSVGNYRASLADLLRIYPLSPEHGHRTIRADTANALGNVYAAIADYKNAEHFYLEAIDYAIANETWVRASIAEYSLASVYRRNDNWEKAAEYFSRSREHSLLADDVQGVAYAEFGLARVAMHLEQLDKAEQMYRASLPVFIEANDILPQVNIANGLANIAFKRKQYAQALQQIETGLTLLEDIAEVDQRYELLKLKSEVEAATGDFRSAHASLTLASAAREEALLARNSESLSEMRVRFDTERQEQQNALLLKENQLSAATLAEQRQTARLYAVSVAALLLVLGFLIYLAYRSKQVRRRLAAQALTDELTGVANRRRSMQALEAEFERARRYRTPLTVAMLDLDHFKQINDRFGHASGDEVLVLFAKAAAHSLRKTDLFGRVGGEEFLAVLPHTDTAMAQGVMERMRHMTLGLQCPSLRGEMQPSVSIGIATLEPDDSSVELLIKRADDAVYRAKRKGRNRVELAESSLADSAATPAT